MFGNYIVSREDSTNNRIRIVTGLIVLLLIMISIMTQLVLAADTPAGYDENDYQKLRSFLELSNGDGVNGDKVSENYDPDDPSTWTGVTWNDEPTKKVSGIFWDRKQLVGDLNLSGFTALQSLVSRDNQLSTLDVTECTALQTLECIYSRLSSLTLSGCTGLQSLACKGNQLNTLDVSECAALQNLDCSFNQLSSLFLGVAPLQTLNCRFNNGLTELDVSNCTTLLSLDCNSCGLSTLDISSLTALKSLICKSNELSSLDVSGLPALQSLDCSSNDLVSLEVDGCLVLQELLCFYNELTTIKLNGLSNLLILNCGNNELTSLELSGCISLQEINSHNNQLTTLDIGDCPGLQTLDLYNNYISSFDVNGHNSLQKLLCNDNQLTSLNIDDCSALQRIECKNNELSSLDVSTCTNLNTLWCSGNDLTSLDVSGLTSLQSLICSSNLLSSIDVSGCTSLEQLSCYSNDLTNLDVSTCLSLSSFQCQDNQLTELDLSSCTLNYFNCQNNRLTFSDLPLPEEVNTYYYGSQAAIPVGSNGELAVGEEIDLSAEVSIAGESTDFTWFSGADEISPTTAVDGRFTFDKGFAGQTIYGQLINSKFPALILETEAVLVVPVMPVIVTQLQDCMIAAGNSATFSIAAETSDGGTLVYQWQLSTDSGNSWSNIDKASSESYTTPALNYADNGIQYRCVVQNTKHGVISDPVYSDPATLSVVAGPAITKQPEDTTVIIGGTTTFSIEAETSDEGALSYQWQLSIDEGGSWEDIAEATVESYTTAELNFADNGKQYRCTVTNTKDGVSSAPVYSDPAILSVVAEPTITIQPEDITADIGDTAAFTIEAESLDEGILNYQWQLWSDNESNWENIANAKEASYSTDELTSGDNGSQYRCKVTNELNGVNSAPVYSEPATLTVNAHQITFIRPTAANDENNPVNINSGSLLIAEISGDLEAVIGVTVKIDQGTAESVNPLGGTIYYLLPANLAEGEHTITIELSNNSDQEILATVTFYWDNYRRGFGFGRFDFGQADRD